MKRISVLALAIICILGSAYGVSKVLHSYSTYIEDSIRSKISQEQEITNQDNKELYNFIEKVMDKVKANVSPSKKEIIINKILGVANKFLNTTEKKQAFIIILSIESKFNQESKSPVGAIGIGQIMIPYFKEFAKTCNLIFDIKDIYDIDANLAVSACHFNKLIDDSGNVLLAVAAYNAGANSHAFKTLKKLGNINQETSNYVARFAYVKSVISEDK